MAVLRTGTLRAVFLAVTFVVVFAAAFFAGAFSAEFFFLFVVPAVLFGVVGAGASLAALALFDGFPVTF